MASGAASSLALVWSLTIFAQVGPFADPGSPLSGSYSSGQALPYAAAAEPASPAPASAVDPLRSDERVLAVSALLTGTPLEPHAAAMVAASDEHGIDWRLLPVIAILESQAGVTACGGNAWGFAKCAVQFASFEEGIPIVAGTLASYGPHDSATLLCIWVSGDGCESRHAIAYTHRASYLYSSLGGTLAVRALPAEDLPPLPDAVTGAVPAAPETTPAPSPSPTPDNPDPSPTPEPSPEAEATLSPTPTGG